jgi:hypothetical protein
MSFDNLQNKWTKQETDLLISLVRGRDITDPDLMEEALENIPTRNRSGIKRKLERLEDAGKLSKAVSVAPQPRRLKPEFKQMVYMLSEEYDLDEIAYAIGVSKNEIELILGDKESSQPQVDLTKVETPKDTKPQLADYVRMIEEGMNIKEAATKYGANLDLLEKALANTSLKDHIRNFNGFMASSLFDEDKAVLAADNIPIPEPITDRLTDDMLRVSRKLNKHVNVDWEKQPFYLNHHKLVRYYYDGQALD